MSEQQGCEKCGLPRAYHDNWEWCWTTRSRELHITKYPWHKLPVLVIHEGVESRTLARFVSEEAKEEFIELAKRGFIWRGEE